jgi:hypothetical protein
MIQFHLDRERGILVVSPEAPLEVQDFAQLASVVDPFLEAQGKLRGLMVHTKTFPGWEDFAGFLAHLRFVRDHHQQIERVAAVTDSTFLSIAPRIASLFINAQVQRFEYDERDKALAWLME